MDFGVARVSLVSGCLGLTTAGTVMGTPTTCRPSRRRPPADFVPTLLAGVVLFEIFTGRLPFRASRGWPP